ncbi:MAG: PaaI family thioesterase [Pyrinomonadaceae bacterium]
MELPSLASSPYQRFLGLTLTRAEDGIVEIRLPFREEFLRQDNSDWLHGGILSALIDIAGDYAIVTKSGVGVPTIDLRVDYLRPARRGDLVAIARTVRVGRTIGVADVEVRDTGGVLVAVGRGVYAMPKE